jgi:hypothetical protein
MVRVELCCICVVFLFFRFCKIRNAVKGESDNWLSSNNFHPKSKKIEISAIQTSLRILLLQSTITLSTNESHIMIV